MKLKIKLLFSILLVFASLFSFTPEAEMDECAAAQTLVLTGVVTSQKTGAILTKGVVVVNNGDPLEPVISGNGEYRIYLMPGANSVVFKKAGYYDATFEVNFKNIINHEYIRYKNVELAPVEKNFRICGTVKDRVTTETIKKAEIRINRQILITNNEGYFECAQTYGDFEISAAADGYFPYKAKMKKEKAEAGPLALMLDRHTIYSVIRGTVAEKSTHEPVRDALVDIAGMRVLTDEEGLFEFRPPRSGRQLLRCSADGYEKIFQSVKLKPGNNKISIFLNKKDNMVKSKK